MRCGWLTCWGALLATLAGAGSVQADVRLPKFMGDHMVLQRDMPIPVWGWGSPGEKVTVKLGDETASATANDKGEWKVTLGKRDAGGPLTLTVTGTNTVTLSDILIGEVWLCSGQSNMEWSVRQSSNAEKELASGNHPQIRQVKFPHLNLTTPQSDVAGTWQICTPETVGNFTACGYFMARELQRELKVPIGLINSSWGGTRIEPWTPPAGFAAVAELKSLSDQVTRKDPAGAAYKKTVADYQQALAAWTAGAQKALAAGEPVPAAVPFPDDLKPFSAHTEPTTLYNGMIHPIVGWPIRGAIWYQGESNMSEGMVYRAKMEALIAGWRKIWGIGDFPFYFVQIAPFQYGQSPSHVLAELWEAQSASAEIPNTGMVVISDIATLNDIHPPNKQDVGKRLSLLALNKTYGRKDVVDSGATFKSLQANGDQLVVTFENTAGSLKSRDGKPLNHFEIIGKEGFWKAADAKIDGDRVILSAEGITQPSAVRFAWHKLAEPNLVNGAGLPSTAFRAGDVPRIDFLPTIKEAAGYQLVYDLDLGKLNKTIAYDKDLRSQVPGKFDRVGYLVELQREGEAPQFVFTSMDAFTDDIKKVGIPTAASGASFQKLVGKLTVVSNVSGVTNGVNLDGGNIEFWPSNYGQQNSANVPGASASKYDFGDQPSAPTDGYGSMQVHNYKGKVTLFAINHWVDGANADLGIGNSTGETSDWTFTRNASQYAAKRLRVLVRPAQ